MQIQQELKHRFSAALAGLTSSPDEAAKLLRPTQDPKFGDYQSNCAMPLKNELGKPPREIAESIVAALQVDDLCDPPEIAGPGFINLRLKDDWLAQQATAMLRDPRLGVAAAANPRTVVLDYSGPNVAKPMHVGHIRSTVIGSAIAELLRFAGHTVITDNHVGDWGTQFGMVIYGYKHFLDREAFASQPVAELLRLYRLVNNLIDYHNSVASLPQRSVAIEKATADLATAVAAEAAETEKKAKKKAQKNVAAAERKLQSTRDDLESTRQKIAAVEADKPLHDLALAHPEIAATVLQETAKLHEGDKENLALWHEVLPYCRDEIDKIYTRLDISFDHQHGESFYHEMLGGVIEQLEAAGLAQPSDGALCVFLPEFEAPMIVRKKDGAYLYATTDLATLEYRMREWSPDEILIVTDHRQAEHFEKVFIVGRKLGCGDVQLKHLPFGTVLDESGKPFKTRSGSTVGLEALLDDAVDAAFAAVCDPDRVAKIDPPLSDGEKQTISRVVGHGAIKYADLAHNRTSDYKFSLEKMVSLDGNTSAYIQYSYARMQSILSRAESSEQQVIDGDSTILIGAPAERALVIRLLQFGEAIDQSLEDYRPNVIVDYLYDVAKAYSSFYEQCPVLKADDDATLHSRLAIVTATARILRQGLKLLGIDVVPRM
ncbi:arginine--tRNA ligase [Rosistilla oblonga]|uniref:arginine--tRNA ligase n=1 Tax=Rosistilla oblonga TaxID=2527990 RepID=UPI003A96D074